MSTACCGKLDTDSAGMQAGPAMDTSGRCQTWGRLEAQISEAVIKFEKEYMGRGPLETKSYIIDDLVVVRLKGVLTQAEKQLATADDRPKGRQLIKQVRIELLEKGRPLLEAAISSLTKVRVVSMHTDISVKTGERVIIFTLEKPPQV
jgi:uncharacterized protein YbcI